MSQWLAIDQIANKVNSGELSATSLISQSLKTIEKHKEYNAIISVVKDRAINRAKEIDTKVKSGEKVGRLAGVPFIAKDNFLTFGSETTAASNILKGFEAPYQATAIERLEAEGAICVAKANLDAFAHGTSTENSDYMVTKNPHNKEFVPGGSSGGPAAAVILDMAPFAVGTDTGGSIRQPASFCGAVGLKPTYGLVSRSGVVAMASSTDTIGPIARNAQDAAIVLDILAGKDVLDSTTIERPEGDYSDLKIDLKGKKIGVIKEYMTEGLNAGVKERVLAGIEQLRALGADIEEVGLPSIDLALACYYIIVPAEISSNLSRYDGQRYGHSSKEAENLDQSYNWSRSEGFGAEAKRRIMIGAYVLSSGYYDAYYKKAAQLRTKLIQELDSVFKSVDYLVGPVAPTTAFKIGKNIDDPLQMYLEDIMTVAFSLAGLPAVSAPVGDSAENSMPVGMQIIGPTGADREILAITDKIERKFK